jgi:hypothetical protein
MERQRMKVRRSLVTAALAVTAVILLAGPASAQVATTNAGIGAHDPTSRTSDRSDLEHAQAKQDGTPLPALQEDTPLPALHADGTPLPALL